MKRSILSPDAVVYVIHHGNEDGRGTSLSEVGKKQTEQVSANLYTAGIQFDLVICPASSLVQQTARSVLRHQHAMRFPVYKEREFDGPAREDDFKAMRALIELVKAKRSIHLVPKHGPRTLYGLCNYEALKTGNAVLDRFREELRSEALSIPDIGNVHRIAVFSNGIVGNVVADALFPQWASELEQIELGPCDILRLSAGGCEHIPLLH